MKAKAARKKRGGKDKKSEAASRTKKGLKRIPPKKVTPKTRKALSTKGKGATVKKSMVKKPRLKVEAARPKNSKVLKSETPLRGKKKSESEALDLPKTSN